MQARAVFFWRRTDVAGLERLAVTPSEGRVMVEGTVLLLEEGGCRIEHSWLLTPEWHTLKVNVVRWDAAGHAMVQLERSGGIWQVNGVARPDLSEAFEPDLSITPFCNALPVRRLMRGTQDTLDLTAAYIDGHSLTVVPSRQRYERKSARLFRYIDLGVARGFEADLVVDEDGMVLHYEHLFERVDP